MAALCEGSPVMFVLILRLYLGALGFAFRDWWNCVPLEPQLWFHQFGQIHGCMRKEDSSHA